MTEKVMEQIAKLDEKNDPALIAKINSAGSLSEIVDILAEQGIQVTEEELSGSRSRCELDEDELDNVSGGSFQTHIITHFLDGFNNGLTGTSSKDDCLSYNLGNRIGYFTWSRRH